MRTWHHRKSSIYKKYRMCHHRQRLQRGVDGATSPTSENRKESCYCWQRPSWFSCC
uniref:Uncharacterized protein n=1 Tax=Arundo donax TaxID=35708 RepID=A0A0A8XT92_ARUDO